jgi:hypothetical protein
MMTLQSISFRKLALAVIPVAFFAVSCQPDETTEPADDRDKFVDSWQVTETSSQVGQTNYEVHINLAPNTTQVQIENFYNVGFSYKAIATVSGTTLTIGNQTYNASQLQGSGSMNGNNTINMNYTVNDGSSIDTCTAVMTRQ